MQKVKERYFSVSVVSNDEPDLVNDKTNPHQWHKNWKRIHVLARIRQNSLQRTLTEKCDYYFTSDCDNFILPHTLSHLIKVAAQNKFNIVAPLLHCVGEPEYSNFFIDKKLAFEWNSSKSSRDIIEMKKRGIHTVPIVHCTYLVQASAIPNLSYISSNATEPWEYLAFSESAERNNLIQGVDNTLYFGYFLHFWSDQESESELLKQHKDKLEELSYLMESNVEFNKVQTILLEFLNVHRFSKGKLKPQ